MQMSAVITATGRGFGQCCCRYGLGLSSRSWTLVLPRPTKHRPQVLYAAKNGLGPFAHVAPGTRSGPVQGDGQDDGELRGLHGRELGR